MDCKTSPVTRIFHGGRGGGAYLKNWDPIINVGMIRCASSGDICKAECPTYRITEIGTTFNVMGNICERRRHEPLGGGGGDGACAPRTFSNLKALKLHFQHSQVDSCVKKVPKTDRYFLFFKL